MTTRQKTIIDKVRFTIWRSGTNGFNTIAPFMSFGYVNLLHIEPNEKREYISIEQIVAAFNQLGKKGEIIKTGKGEVAWLDHWKIAPGYIFDSKKHLFLKADSKQEN